MVARKISSAPIQRPPPQTPAAPLMQRPVMPQQQPVVEEPLYTEQQVRELLSRQREAAMLEQYAVPPPPPRPAPVQYVQAPASREPPTTVIQTPPRVYGKPVVEEYEEPAIPESEFVEEELPTLPSDFIERPPVKPVPVLPVNPEASWDLMAKRRPQAPAAPAQIKVTIPFRPKPRKPDTVYTPQPDMQQNEFAPYPASPPEKKAGLFDRFKRNPAVPPTADMYEPVQPATGTTFGPSPPQEPANHSLRNSIIFMGVCIGIFLAGLYIGLGSKSATNFDQFYWMIVSSNILTSFGIVLLYHSTDSLVEAIKYTLARRKRNGTPQ